MRLIDTRFWKDRNVVVTGHMGFKGAWLCSLLSRLGARTWGYGHDNRRPLLYTELDIAGHTHVDGDINDIQAFADCVERSGASVVFHLAAQSIVLASYRDPLRTFEDNIMGTARVLEVARHAKQLRAVIVVTSDKVYRNTASIWGYREIDVLGGNDPYSASKAAAEILAEAMARSFFVGPSSPALATVRAGNVIGGGDWAEFRLLPDAARALAKGEPLVVRNPESTRPWQHVLDPLCGYVLLAEDIATDSARSFGGYNFGPAQDDVLPVREIADMFVGSWGSDARWQTGVQTGLVPKEAAVLSVDSTLARRRLGWSPRWRVDDAVRRTAEWYRDFARGIGATSLVHRDIDAFFEAQPRSDGPAA